MNAMMMITSRLYRLFCPCRGGEAPRRAGEVAHSFLWQCKFAAMQFVVLKPTLTLIHWGAVLGGAEAEGAFWDPHAAAFYTTLPMNFSVGFAFYGLLKFFHATETHLAAHNPWPKFLCIKGVVFLTFWQGLVITLLARTGLQDAAAASSMQNFIICVEMFLASLAHAYVYGHQEWEPGWQPPQEHLHLSDNVAIGDFIADGASRAGTSLLVVVVVVVVIVVVVVVVFFFFFFFFFFVIFFFHTCSVRWVESER